MNKGQNAKLRTKEWLEAQGYVVGYMENMKQVRRGIFVKQDVLGADCIGVRGHETILVNSIFGSTLELAKSNASKHIKRFLEFPDGGMKRILVFWTPYAREPEIREINESEVK